MVGTPCQSYLGVPIMLGDEAIGVISVQSTEGGPLRRGGRAPAGHARGERRRRDPERAALPRGPAPATEMAAARRGRPRDLGDAGPGRGPRRIAERARSCSRRDERALPRRDGRPTCCRPIVAVGRVRRRDPSATRSGWARASSATSPAGARPDSSTTSQTTRGRIQIAGHRGATRRAPDGRAARRRGEVIGMMAVWRTGGAAVHDRRTSTSWSASRSRPPSRSRTRGCSTRRRRRRTPPSRPTRRRARSSRR